MPGDDNGSASVSPVDDGKFTAVNSAAQAPEAPTGAPGQGVVFGGAQVGTPKDDWEEKTDNGKRKRSDSLEGERPEITAARIVAAQDSLASAEGEHQTPVNQRTVIEGSIYSDRDRYDEDTNMADAAGGHGAESSPQPPGSAPRRKRQFTNRTKTGCITCRKRKKKCDEGKPECANCKRGGFNCEGYTTKHTYQGKPPVGDALHRPLPAPLAPGFGPARSPVVRVISTDEKLTPGVLPRGQVYTPHSDIHAVTPHQLPPLPTDYGATTEERVMALQGTPTPSSASKSDKDRMLLGELYSPFAQDLTTERELCKAACWRYNNAATNPNLGISKIEQGRLLLEVLRPGRQWEPAPAVAGGYMADGYSSDLIDVTIEAPFTCSYGYNIRLGKGVHIHMGCLIQDSNLVTIKDGTILSPNVSIYCAIYPMDPRKRSAARGSEIAKPVTIAEDVWIGGNVVILGGVTIGKGAVIGAGSVVTMDIPPYTQAAGNPAQVIRGLGYTNGIDNM